MRLGAGRAAQGGRIDHAVGVVVHRKRGDRVEAGEPLATVHARREPGRAVAGVLRDRRRAGRARRCCLRTMPELPEVETVRRGLVPVLAGHELTAVEIRDGRLTAPADPMRSRTTCWARSSTGVGRRGKYLTSSWTTAARWSCHLRMTGWYHHVPELVERPHLRARVRTGRRQLAALLRPAPVRHDAADRGRAGWRSTGAGGSARSRWTVPGRRRCCGPRCGGRLAPVKALLLDQQVVAGVGNIYADEALWIARIHPLTPGAAIGAVRAGRLHDAVIAVLERGIEHQGASIDTYRSVDGEPGSMQERFAVYDREGEPCLRCGGPIRKIRVAQRGTHYCPRCTPRP